MVLREAEHDYVNDEKAMNSMRSEFNIDSNQVPRFLQRTFCRYIFFVKRAVR